MRQYLVVEYMTTHQKCVPVSSRTVHDATSEICQCLVVQYMMKHQKYVPVSSCRVHDFWCVAIYSTTRYWHIFLMLHRVLENYLLVHTSDVTSCTVQLDTGTYFRCSIVYSTTRYCHILVTLPLENKDIIDGQRQNMLFKEPQSDSFQQTIVH
jgi:hypothetical protein